MFIINKIVMFLFIIPILLIAQQKSTDHSNYDKSLSIKYGLVIPEYSDKIDPAPEWFRNIDMIFTDWSVKSDMLGSHYKLWKGYRVELKDTLVERIVRLAPLYSKVKVHEQVPVTIDGNFDGSAVKGVKLISHVPHSKLGFKQAHEQGFKVIPYVHFTDIHSYYADQDVFLFNHPEVLLKDKNGGWVHLPMDGTDRFYRHLVCTNNPEYWKLSLDYVKKMMDWGADGLFIDNVGKRNECFAPNFTKLNPEFGPYVHEHLFPDTTHNYAFDRFLQTVRSLVKSYGDDKIIILNSGIGTEFQKDGDCNMMESFIYSWAWEGRNPKQNWEYIKNLIEKNKWYTDAGKKLTALSYLNPSRKEVKDDAFWAFSMARLLGIIWWANLENTGAEKLYQTHMGNELQTLQEFDNVAYKVFQNGIIVLNNNDGNKTVSIKLPMNFNHKQLYDLFSENKKLNIVKGKIEVTIPGKKARIYLIKDIE